MNMKIYALECEGDKYYIGRTTKSAEARLQEHWSAENTCAFTNKYKPFRVIEEVETDNPYDEDALTKKYMAVYGIDNVRGGSYSNPELADWQRKALEHELTATSDLCFTCKERGHFADACPTTSYVTKFEKLEEIDEELSRLRKTLSQVHALTKKLATLEFLNGIEEEVVFYTKWSKEAAKHGIQASELRHKINATDERFARLGPGQQISPESVGIRKDLSQELAALIKQHNSLLEKTCEPRGNLCFINGFNDDHNKFQMAKTNAARCQNMHRQILGSNKDAVENSSYIAYLELVNYANDLKRELATFTKGDAEFVEETENKMVQLLKKRISLTTA